MFHTRNGVYMYSFGDDCSLEHLLERPYQESCNQMKVRRAHACLGGCRVRFLFGGAHAGARTLTCTPSTRPNRIITIHRQPPLTRTPLLLQYGSSTPLQYDLGRIHSGLKAAILSGAFDIMATPEDVAVLRGAWNATVVFDKQYPRTAHMDFVWARDPIMKRDILDLMWRHAPAAARG